MFIKLEQGACWLRKTGSSRNNNPIFTQKYKTTIKILNFSVNLLCEYLKDLSLMKTLFTLNFSLSTLVSVLMQFHCSLTLVGQSDHGFGC